MNVLNVFTHYEPGSGGGGAERTLQMSNYLLKQGCRCTVLTTDPRSGGYEKESNGINIIALPCIVRRYFIPRFLLRKIKKVVAEADIIHLMAHWSILNALVFFYAVRLKRPYVLCSAGTLRIYGRSKLIKKMYNMIIGKRIIKGAAGYIAVSTNEIDHFKYYGISADKISVIPNGINAEDFRVRNDVAFRKNHGLGDGPIIMFVGRLNRIKGPDLLLKAFCKIKNDFWDHQLVFVGPDGGMLDELKKVVAGYDIFDRVHFIECLSGADKSLAYHAADLLVIPSRQEAMSIVVLEAGITRTPVLITDQCGFNEISEVDGGLVVPATIEGLKNGLKYMLCNANSLIFKGNNLNKFVRAHYNWDDIINQHLRLYETILAHSIVT